MKYIKLFEELEWKVEVEEITNILQDFIDEGYNIKIEDLSNPKILGSDIIKITLTVFVPWERVPRIEARNIPSDYMERERQDRNGENARLSRDKCFQIRDEICERLYEFGFDPKIIEKEDKLQPIGLSRDIDPQYSTVIKIFKRPKWSKSNESIWI